MRRRSPSATCHRRRARSLSGLEENEANSLGSGCCGGGLRTSRHLEASARAAAKEFTRKDGSLVMVQLWVNLPAKYTMSPPRYEDVLGGRTLVVALAHAGRRVREHHWRGLRDGDRPSGDVDAGRAVGPFLRAGKTVRLRLPTEQSAAPLFLHGNWRKTRMAVRSGSRRPGREPRTDETMAGAGR